LVSFHSVVVSIVGGLLYTKVYEEKAGKSSVVVSLSLLSLSLSLPPVSLVLALQRERSRKASVQAAVAAAVATTTTRASLIAKAAAAFQKNSWGRRETPLSAAVAFHRRRPRCRRRE